MNQWPRRMFVKSRVGLSCVALQSYAIPNRRESAKDEMHRRIANLHDLPRQIIGGCFLNTLRMNLRCRRQSNQARTRRGVSRKISETLPSLETLRGPKGRRDPAAALGKLQSRGHCFPVITSFRPRPQCKTASDPAIRGREPTSTIGSGRFNGSNRCCSSCFRSRAGSIRLRQSWEPSCKLERPLPFPPCKVRRRCNSPSVPSERTCRCKP